MYSIKSGYVQDLKAKTLGVVSMKLGGGRQMKDDTIDYSVGLVLYKKIGDYVKQGEPLLEVHTNHGLSQELIDEILSAYSLSDTFVKKPQLIEEIVES